MINFFGIRHLSPAGAFHLRNFLEAKKPRLVLVEGPCDLNDQMKYMVHPQAKPPFAILAYTKSIPVRTILYPYAEYSPEYQAVLWCHEHQVECRFIDLPSDVFLALEERKLKAACMNQELPPHSGDAERNTDLYEALDQLAGEGGQETFWERTLEHAQDAEAYRKGAYHFGRNLRELTLKNDDDKAETRIREAFMSRQIQDAVKRGIEPEEIVVVTGAYHVNGLWSGTQAVISSSVSSNTKNGEYAGNELKAEIAEDERNAERASGVMTDQEITMLPRMESSHTLMPYSYYRLSSRSGYGAGNKAPAYYALLWDSLKKGDLQHTAYNYLSRIAAYQREHGTPVSSAEVIEAVRLASSLAQMRGGKAPVLCDLRDAAVTCLGGGSFSAISLAVAETEIGSAIGVLPEGVSRTSIQEDFYRQLKNLKLDTYYDLAARDLKLDLRENRNVKTEKAAFLDLHRSFFLHQLAVLEINFAQKQKIAQENATWSEHWVIRWTPEAEIELVEAALKGDTVELAAAFCMKERIENASGMADIAAVIEDAFSCGMEKVVQYATAALQAIAVDAVSLEELAITGNRLSVVIQYGTIRQLNPEPLVPVLQQIFYRACLILPSACICDDNGSDMVITSMEYLNRAALAHEFLDQEIWQQVLEEIAFRDDLNTKISGFSAAVLLERSKMDTEMLRIEVSRRLSKGIPADLGAGWFEGLAMKNRYGLIARLSLWENLDAYLDTLDDEEFKRALVFLRRAFADFTSLEKDQIAENLGEIWNLNGQQVSEAVNTALDEEAQEMLDSLEDFDFDF